MPVTYAAALMLIDTRQSFFIKNAYTRNRDYSLGAKQEALQPNNTATLSYICFILNIYNYSQ